MDVHMQHNRLDTVSLDGWRIDYGNGCRTSSKYLIGPMIREELLGASHSAYLIGQYAIC